jgi:hypothetical protein
MSELWVSPRTPRISFRPSVSHKIAFLLQCLSWFTVWMHNLIALSNNIMVII